MKPFAALFLLFAASASAATVTLNPIADAFVAASNPTSNYGAAGALALAAAGTAKGEFDSVIRFDFASVESSFDSAFGVNGWAIDSITLRLTTANPNNALFNSPNVAGQFLIKWMQSDAWSEGDGTPMPTPDSTGLGITFSGAGSGLSNYLSAADESLGTFTPSTVTTGSNNTYTLGLTPGFLADAKAGNLVGFLTLSASSNVAYLFNSVNNTTAANRPLLTVNASVVPEPGAGALLAATTMAWLARRRRHARVA